MGKCSACGHESSDDDVFCGKCGRKIEISPDAPAAPVKRKWRRTIIIAGIAIQVAVMGFFFSNKGCSKIEGTFVSKGEPVGTFSFKPDSCKSGQRRQFYGVVLLGKGPQDGAIVLIEDPVKGKIVKVEVPDSCQPPDYERCKEVILDPGACTAYNVVIRNTMTSVNKIRLLDGSLKLNCNFMQGGTVQADMVFTGCD